jgi:hypothetical protein
MLKKFYIFASVVIFSLSFASVSSAQTILTDVIDNIFNYDLYKTSQGADVIKLQKVLNLDGDTVVSCGGTGSVGNESDYFGPATEKAVIKFQNKYSISPANGYVGQKTRDVLNAVYRCYFISNECTPQIPMKTVASACVVRETPVVTKNEGLSICKLVELLISVDAIKKDKIDQARSVASQYDSSGSCGTMFVELKANNEDSVSIMSGAPVTLSWKSNGVTSCKIGTQSQSASGTQIVYPYQSDKFTIVCKGKTSDVSDSVSISIFTENFTKVEVAPPFDYATTSTDLAERSTDLCLIKKTPSGYPAKPVHWMASTSYAYEDLTNVISSWQGIGPSFASSSIFNKTYIKGLELFTQSNDQVTTTTVKATYKKERITFTCIPEVIKEVRLEGGECNILKRIWSTYINLWFIHGKCSAF